MRKLVFVIINYNTPLLALRLYESIKDYKSISKIIIVDNNSTDKSYEKIKKKVKKSCEVIKSSSNNGFSSGMNIGCKRAIELYEDCDIILSNTDIIVCPDDEIKELQELLQQKELAVIAPVICQGNTLSRGWKVPTAKQEALINLPGVGKLFQKHYELYKEEYYQDKISMTEAVSGCFFMIKSKDLEKVNFFDEKVFLYYEENILASKLKKINKKTAVCNDIAVIHEHSVSVDKSISYINKFKILKESQYYFQKEYGNASKMSLSLLKFSRRLTLITLYIRVFIKGGFKK